MSGWISWSRNCCLGCSSDPWQVRLSSGASGVTAMIFSVGIKPRAIRDVQNLQRQAPEAERPRIGLAAEYLMRVELREDAHLKGEPSPNDPSFRKLTRGPVQVFYHVRSLDDRYVEVLHFHRAEPSAET